MGSFVKNQTSQEPARTPCQRVQSYRGLVQNFDGVLICNIPLPESLFQCPQWKCLPLPKNHQVNVTEEETDDEI